MRNILCLLIALVFPLLSINLSAQNNADIQLHIKGKVHYLKNNSTVWFDSNGDIHSKNDFDKLYKLHTEMLNDVGCPNMEIEKKGRDNARTLILEDCSFTNSGSKLNEIKLEGLRLQCSYFNKSNFSGMQLNGTTMYYAKLHKANFSKANLHNSDLSGSDLTGAFLDAANLTNVDLTGSG